MSLFGTIQGKLLFAAALAFSPFICEADNILYHATASGDKCVQYSTDEYGDVNEIVFYYDDDCYCDYEWGSYIDRIDDRWPGRKKDAWVDQLTHYNG